ncbi:ATP-dependent (S)-NAD(P)H-hydrate dehydratase isoform X2 [Chelonus insularis]|nr:ATP-dependent (S)-NAD(P)H-hydrate dehydratase isoform X2 [Chelonus insularis]XP_034943450.1 ATP-dependent (S)-NAD(P)H-hydrate dehydratase isoform X2 [Chelonus insularis]XP_034943451.1 ATP-dependent (S)-NAD(P)H-hydrate dehydratase isoform X2 [Chelonus insularis]XP_034943452.1 ATP-dependent (S)-NAD(P)H-hydrate dehydratase isoform X2 [Chelonus insularis]XP_034943453.1 ATP-dependent (S)-NAD(P)H-hydrate dehydratase isoform X2 [Chelonus insularis]XP_034943454.1 ATP-dependent (S)-NAD(P)H-hydrate d
MSSQISLDERVLKSVRKIVPSLTTTKYKGQDGRIGIFGGSMEYTGAPYFAAMSAFRVGADLVHIFCCKDAGVAIKSFSPEPIVHPLLDHPDAIRQIKPWLDRLHVILIGPGLGRDDKIFKVITEVISLCRDLRKPLVIDADGLYLLCQKPDIIRDYPGVILTPNAMELSRLMKAFLDRTVQPAPVAKISDLKHLADSIGKSVVILNKGAKDIIVDGQKGSEAISCAISGSGRRCGGQGDLLSGSLAVFWWWALSAGPSECSLNPPLVAAYAASRLTRECNAAAFREKQRSMLTTDMLEQIHPVFSRLFEITKLSPILNPRRSKSEDI